MAGGAFGLEMGNDGFYIYLANNFWNGKRCPDFFTLACDVLAELWGGMAIQVIGGGNALLFNNEV